MQRKLFMQKNMMTKGKQTYMKLFLWSAIALIALVIVTPFITRHKGGKDAVTRKPIPEKGGMVVKGIPKAEAPAAESQPPVDEGPGLTPGSSSPNIALAPQGGGGAEEHERPPDPIEKSINLDVTPTGKKVPIPSEAKPGLAERSSPGQSAAQPGFAQQVFKESTPQASPAQSSATAAAVPAAEKSPKEKLPAHPAKTAEQPPAVAAAQAGKQKLAAVTPMDNKKAVKPAAGPTSSSPSAPMPGAVHSAAPAEPAKKPAEGGPLLFSVQVGSFREKHNAEEMRQTLQKKGYDVIIKSVEDPKLGSLYVVQLQPVADVGKASTQMMQIKNEEKVKPVIKRVPTGQ